jgi:hypothetical protein
MSRLLVHGNFGALNGQSTIHPQTLSSAKLSVSSIRTSSLPLTVLVYHKPHKT